MATRKNRIVAESGTAADEKAARVLITMTPQLLAAADAAANIRGLTRAALIRQAVLDWLARQSQWRKSA